ncbi:hypothetical protein JCM19237_5004 [Photobacterium aphoticum]|uniref:Uncharacterized protein n=1 Tax=Photobacterium aphoticum TaxID=754436 RepID=A0A090QGR0_9GAMM|nr:hypothetical protein JCM19237_5004 [Photobacterium aphoticum]
MSHAGDVFALTEAEQLLCQAYQRGDSVVVLGEAPVDDSEWYADWSAYLNEAIATYGESVRVVSAQSVPNFLVDQYSVLMGQRAKPSYVLEEVVEPQVYTYVHAVYTGEAIPEEVKAFKPQHVDNLFDKVCLPQ